MSILGSSESPASFVKLAHALADAARRETEDWRRDRTPQDKSDGGAFDPVTEADVGAERAMRRLIEQRHPDHGIAGEELEARTGSGRYRWSLDPIDGTRSFICGLPSWVTLIGLLDQELPILGLIDAPRLDERYVGYGETALIVDRNGKRPIAASSCRSLAEARLSTTDPFLFSNVEAPCFERVRSSVRLLRYGHDGYAYARLAAGGLDLVIEAGLKPHDYNALIPVVRAAGGVIGDWHGGSDFSKGRVVAAATLSLYDEAIEQLDFQEE